MTSQAEIDAAFAIVKEARRLCSPLPERPRPDLDSPHDYDEPQSGFQALDLSAPFTRSLTWRERWRGTIMIAVSAQPRSPYSIEFQLLSPLRRLVKQYDSVVHKRRHDDRVRTEAEKVVRDLVMEGALKP